MIENVHYGGFTIVPWYESPGFLDCNSKASRSFRSREPPSIWKNITDYNDPKVSISVCPRCFLYTSDGNDIENHLPYCRYAGYEGPGRLVYRSPKHSLHEIQADSESSKLYIQCLSIFGRLFLETKSICFALENFVLYTLVDSESGLVGGFFSKELESWFEYNLACIVVFPPFQKRGFARAMISYSYFLSRQAGTFGSPEKPLSSLGAKTYMAYWCDEVVRTIAQNDWESSNITINNIAKKTGIDPRDVVAALNHIQALEQVDGKLSISASKLKEFLENHALPCAFDESYVV